MHPIVATASNVTNRLESIPANVWLKIGIGVAALVVAMVVLRTVLKINKVILGVIVFLVCTFIGFNWIYQRNEPAWATPVVSKLAEFFPSKGK